MDPKIVYSSLLIVFIALLGCNSKKSVPEESPLSLGNMSIAKEFEGWKKTARDYAVFYTSPDSQFLISIARRNDENVSGAINQLQNLLPPEFSIDHIKEATISGKTGKEVEITYSGEPQMKLQINLLAVGDDIVHVNIAMPLGEASFLTEPDKWPAFLEGISLPIE